MIEAYFNHGGFTARIIALALLERMMPAPALDEISEVASIDNAHDGTNWEAFGVLRHSPLLRHAKSSAELLGQGGTPELDGRAVA